MRDPATCIDRLKETPSQTAGPYLHIGCAPAAAGLEMRRQEALWRAAGAGERLTLSGVVYDGAGEPVRDAMVEAYLHDAEGACRWARAVADFATGAWTLETPRPASTPDAAGRAQAAHWTLLVFARGINIHLHTRAYLADAAALAAEPALARLSAAARATLLAAATGGDAWRFDIRLQGPQETVFFDV